MNPSYLTIRRSLTHQSSMRWMFLITLHMGMDFFFFWKPMLSRTLLGRILQVLACLIRTSRTLMQIKAI